MLLLPHVVLGVHTVRVLAFCIYLSSELKQFIAPPSLCVLEYYGEKVRSFGFVSYPVNGS